MSLKAAPWQLPCSLGLRRHSSSGGSCGFCRPKGGRNQDYMIQQSGLFVVALALRTDCGLPGAAKPPKLIKTTLASWKSSDAKALRRWPRSILDFPKRTLWRLGFSFSPHLFRVIETRRPRNSAPPPATTDLHVAEEVIRAVEPPAAVLHFWTGSARTELRTGYSRRRGQQVARDKVGAIAVRPAAGDVRSRLQFSWRECDVIMFQILVYVCSMGLSNNVTLEFRNACNKTKQNKTKNFKKKKMVIK